MELKIEKGIPIPNAWSGRPGLNWSATIRAMEIGDSFYAPVPSRHLGSRVQSYRKEGIGLTVRKEGDGCRIWRTA